MDDDIIRQEVRRIQEAEYKIIEQVLEESIQSGAHGVLIIRDQMGILIKASVNEDVPYGIVHERRLHVDRTLPTPEESG